MKPQNTSPKYPSTTRKSAAAVAAELREIDDTSLIARCLGRDEAAWREFVRRYEAQLRGNIRKTVSRAMASVLDSDAIDDMIGDFYLRILDENMAKLRTWYEGPRRASVVTWLTMIANGIAIDHVRHAYDCMSGRNRAVDKRREADEDPNRGATWFAIEDRNTRDPIKKKRNRKSRDDE